MTQEQYAEAEKQSVADGISVEQAMLLMGLATPEQIGLSMSAVYRMPYLPLKGRTVSRGAKSALSRECAEAWKVFPIDHDPLTNLLTVAVAHPDSAEKVERVCKFFLESYDVAFTISSEPEIAHALSVQFEDVVSGPAGGDKRISTIRIPKSALRQKQHKSAAQTKNLPGDFAGEQSSELIEALISAVSLLVAAHLEANPKSLAKTRARARYCQLLADRLGLAPAERTKTILAAWASGLEEKRGIIKQLSVTYNIENIIFGGEDNEDAGIEKNILAIVRSYEALEEEFAAESRDVNAVRRNLLVRSTIAVEHQDLLETFLQVLMDEQFLGNLNQTVGTILIVDPTGTVISEIEGPLGRAGYSVYTVMSVDAAMVSMKKISPDLVMAHAGSSARDMLHFCKEMKKDSATQAVPLIVLLNESSDVRGAEFLRAGAADFLPEPVDLELLYLRLEKELVAKEQPAGREGVTGSLADMSFSDMIQVLSAGCKSAAITVSRGNETGRLFMRDGNVIHAEVNDVAGDKAFYTLMQWAEGDFSMTECRDYPEPTIKSSTMSLLMEGARLVDESLKP
ncbi:MAG: DUF4388 domain-containing protein [Lentisphaerae bacterium]|nr:DUF4388 domain-containing protein [Lentisphaerota bacterium]